MHGDTNGSRLITREELREKVVRFSGTQKYHANFCKEKHRCTHGIVLPGAFLSVPMRHFYFIFVVEFGFGIGLSGESE
jgi:hypothetical protein